MKPLAEFPLAERAAIDGVLLDIDDTLTTEGSLTAAAYAALGRLSDAGLRVVPVTGRPAGWCDHIARMWPVDGVVGENGAFWFAYDRAARKLVKRFVTPDAGRAARKARLAQITAHIVAAVPGSAPASDQNYREADIAIDFCEDVPALPRAEVERIAALMREAGLTAKISSIHVNGWFGDYDKLSTTRLFLRERAGVDLDADRTRYVFAGDSPNDAPMFEFFPNAVGVANVRDFGGWITVLPAWITTGRCGAGFVELADALLEARTPAVEGPVLRGARVSVRPMAARDAAAIFGIFSDPAVTRYLSTPPMTEVAQAAQRIARAVADWKTGVHLMFAIERGDGTVIGTASLFRIDRDSGRAEIGYSLGAAHWGQGYAQEAMRLAIDYAFGELALRRLEADIDPRNAASARVLQRMGFREEGRLLERWRVAGEISDSGLYGLLARDWPGGGPSV